MLGMGIDACVETQKHKPMRLGPGVVSQPGSPPPFLVDAPENRPVVFQNPTDGHFWPFNRFLTTGWVVIGLQITKRTIKMEFGFVAVSVRVRDFHDTQFHPARCRFAAGPAWGDCDFRQCGTACNFRLLPLPRRHLLFARSCNRRLRPSFMPARDRPRHE